MRKNLAQELTVKIEQLRHPTECRTCLFDSSIARIHDDGECEYCKLQEELRNQAREPFTNVVDRIKKKGRGKKYDCLVGISGGEDSSVLLYLAVKVWGLRPLTIHFDNHYNTKEANSNIEILVKNLNVDFIRYYLNKKQYDTINEAMVWGGTCDADINNDNAMAGIMDRACKQYKIKYLLNGHDFRNEGSSPSKWSRIDPKYMANVYRKYTGLELVNYPILTIWDQIRSGLLGIKQIRPFHYDKIDRQPIMKELKEWGWQSYGSKHAENNFTLWVGGYLLPSKFKIDKRLTYLSARIREGMITKYEAKEFLKHEVKVSSKILGANENKLMQLAKAEKIKDRTIYGGYNFKRWKPVLWILAKLQIIPWTFYAKYCK